MATTGGNGNPRRDRRLKSWKEIAAFFGADERTVKRWEQSRGLPIRRIPGGARPTVYADVAELESWLRGRVQREHRPEAVLPRPETPSRRRFIPLAMAMAALLAGIGTIVGISQLGPSAAREHRPSQKASDFYLAGVFHLERRTPERLRRALALFDRAIAEDAQYAEAHAGRADAYLLLREYAGMPEAEAYRSARAAAQRALELNDRLPQAHAALAFVTFYWDRGFNRGLQSFERAIELDPASARARHWYATALYHTGRLDAALAAIDEAQRIDPHSRSILADKGLILYTAGRKAEALSLLRQVAQNEADFLSAPRYLALIHLAEGEDADYLREAGTAARLARDPKTLSLLEAAQRGLNEGGREGMLRAMLALQLRLLATGQDTAYAPATSYAMLGQRAEAVRYLELAAARRDQNLISLRVDPRLSNVRSDPAFRRMWAAIASDGS